MSSRDNIDKEIDRFTLQKEAARFGPQDKAERPGRPMLSLGLHLACCRKEVLNFIDTHPWHEHTCKH